MSLIFAGVTASNLLNLLTFYEDKNSSDVTSRLFQLLIADCCAHIILTGGHAVVSWVRSAVQLVRRSRARAR